MIKWVARLALITALLGLIGTIIIISNISAGEEEEKTVKAEKKAVLPSTIVTDTPIAKAPAKSIIPVNPDKKIVAAPKKTPVPKTVAIIKDSAKKLPAAAAKNEDKMTVMAKPKEPAKSEKQEESKKEPEEKLFSPQELQELVGRINRAREENGISSNCVQIHTTKQGNYPRTISQVETYLKSHRFAIAGREVVSKKVKGILISAIAGCIRITIGTF